MPAQREPGGAYRTLIYEVTGRVARITVNRPEHGNAITSDTPTDLAHAVERADLDPRVHVMLVFGPRQPWRCVRSRLGFRQALSRATARRAA